MPAEFGDEDVNRLRMALGRVVRGLDRRTNQRDLTRTQLTVLGTIGRTKRIALATLAEFEGINPTMLSRIVTKLDGDGLIRRMPNPDDQRAVLVEATEQGRETSERIRAARTAVVTKLAGGLPPRTAAALLVALPALEAMAGLIGTDNQAPDPPSAGA